MSRKSYYMLRKTLPLWKAEETIEEVIGFCRLNRVAEVIWKIDTEEFSHGLPSLELIGKYLPCLNRARRALNRHKIKSSLNPWVTMCHADRGRNALRYHPGMRMFVNGRGNSHSSRACPMDQVWQDWLIAAYKLYASTKPEILWLEDDLTNLPKECQGEYVPEYGCFCEDHLAEISRISGVSRTRDQLLDVLKRPGEPLPVRKLWFDLHSRTMLRLAERLEPAVHKISAGTKLGLMCSYSTDGRWWDDFVRKISGKLEPVVRPSLSTYQEQRPTIHLFDNMDHRRESLCVPKESRVCPELENWPFTVFTKSTRFTRLEFGISQLMGYPDITINIFDHLGTPVKESKRYYRLLKEIKPKLDGIAAKASGDGGREKGVGIIFRKNSADFLRLKEGQTTTDLSASAFGDIWARALQGSGIAVKWDEEASVLAVSGQVLRACTASEIKKILSRGVLLDGSAVEVLCQMGFSELIGCRHDGWFSRHSRVLTVEEFLEAGGRPQYQKFSSLENPFLNNIAALSLDKKVQVISCLANNDRERKVPGMALCENSLGGRVAVYPIDLSAGTGDGFVDWHRKEQLRSVVNWLGRGRTDLLVEGGAWMIPLRRDFSGYIFIGLANLETDSWDRITLTLSTERKISKVKRVRENGSWRNCRAKITRPDDLNVRIEMGEGLEYMDFTAFALE